MHIILLLNTKTNNSFYTVAQTDCYEKVVLDIHKTWPGNPKINDSHYRKKGINERESENREILSKDSDNSTSFKKERNQLNPAHDNYTNALSNVSQRLNKYEGWAHNASRYIFKAQLSTNNKP